MNFIRNIVLFFHRIILTVCLILVVASMYPRPLQASDSLPFSQDFQFSPYPNSRTSIVNHFLLKIAEGNGKLRAYTSYNLGGLLRYSIHKDDHGRCMLNLQTEDIVFMGDITYKAFSLEKLLLPDMMSFELTINTVVGNQVLKKSFTDVKISADGRSEVVLSEPGICNSSTNNIDISRLTFYYSEQLFGNFEAWLDALETYYNAGDALLQVDAVLHEISLEDPEQLIMNEFILCEAEQRMAEIRYASFHRWLDLSRGDPEKLLVDYSRLSFLTDSLRRGFNNAIARIDTLLYEKALSLQKDDDLIEAQRLFHQALVYNPYHIPSKLSIASYELKTGKQAMALLRLEKILSEIYPTGIWEKESVGLSARVIHKYLMDVSELNVDGRFLDALGMLSDVERFCFNTEGRYNCPELLVYHMTNAHKGMFQSFMVVAERAFRNGNLPFSVEYLKSALSYQAGNIVYVPDRSQAIELMKKVVIQYRQKGDESYLKGNFEEASNFFLTARGLCETYPFIECGE
jgi:tetratricopeptide (TPR) repeat protein